jgi:phosphomannomutase
MGDERVRQALLLDVDNTLTPPRQPLNQEMGTILGHLTVPFHIAAGSDLALVDDQFLGPLFDFGFRRSFDAFLSNGAIHYSCDYSDGKDIRKVSQFNIAEYLGDKDYRSLIEALKSVLEDEKFALPKPLEVIGDRIIDRGSMINLCPIGRLQRENSETLANRHEFVKFDRSRHYREQIIGYLATEVASLIKGRGLTITLGGQTSFDIGIADQDKTIGVRYLLNAGVERIVFLGDALFDGGNDASMRRFVERWVGPDPCPLEAIPVDSWRHTIVKFRDLGFLADE